MQQRVGVCLPGEAAYHTHVDGSGPESSHALRSPALAAAISGANLCGLAYLSEADIRARRADLFAQNHAFATEL
jgi:hypothetical protein